MCGRIISRNTNLFLFSLQAAHSQSVVLLRGFSQLRNIGGLTIGLFFWFIQWGSWKGWGLGRAFGGNQMREGEIFL